MRKRIAILAVLCLVAAASTSNAAEPDAKQLAFFEKKIRPVLVQHCYKCHSAQSKSVKAGLLLDTQAGIRKGGESGPAVVPGDVGESLLINAIKHEDFEMPPKGKLPDSVVADFVTWVKMGAPDPRGGEIAVKQEAKKIDWEKARDFWSFKPPQKENAPDVKNPNWPRSEIDRFVLAELEERGLNPVADAERIALVRRVYFDLVGLPPSPEEVDAFLADKSPKAFEKLVDKLLDSPRFGERWGRHWLDIARYAESNGNADNTAFPHAWRYRDYVIASFNSDKPYDRFITEQLAGDLLPFDTPRQRNQQLIATGFLALGSKPRSQNNPNFQMDVVAEQIEVTTSAVLGLTVMCARCHDHKFDPIPTAEYYGLAGIFTSTSTLYGSGGGKNRTPARGLLGLLSEDDRAAEKIAQHAQQLKTLTNRQKDLTSQLNKLGVKQNKNPKLAKQIANLQRKLQRLKAANANEKQVQKIEKALARYGVGVDASKVKDPKQRQQIKTLQMDLKKVEADLAKLRASAPQKSGVAMGIREGNPADTQICIRGESQTRGERVPRGFVTVATTGEAPKIDDKASGRLELAKWMTDPQNPLTSRVMVNRIWYHLFGRGLVTTLDNFGALGDTPSHPALLDHLAIRFVKDGWSIKRMIRTIMLSRTYQMSSNHDADNYGKDPDNMWLWRMSPRRLDAEALRDALLATSGLLDLDPPAPQPVQVDKRGRPIPANNNSNSPCRSVYLPIVRNGVPEALGLFDFADPSIVVGQRDVTTVPAQSLYLMNSPFIVRQAEAMGERVLVSDGKDMNDEQRVDHAFRLALARRPTDEQRERALAYIQRITESLGDQRKGNAESAAWASLCQSLLASAEFRYLE